MHVSVVGGFREITQDVKKEGELTREAILQMTSNAGKLLNFLPSHIYNTFNIMSQKSDFVTPPTPDTIPTQGGRNV